MSDNNPDNLILQEDDTSTPEQFQENVRNAGRQVGSQVSSATKKDPKKANTFAQAGKVIVQQLRTPPKK